MDKIDIRKKKIVIVIFPSPTIEKYYLFSLFRLYNPIGKILRYCPFVQYGKHGKYRVILYISLFYPSPTIKK